MPPAPRVRDHLAGLVGGTIRTATGLPNRIIALDGNRITVGTGDPEDPGRDTLSLSKAQEAADRVFAGEEVPINTGSVGPRSAFVGAVLRSLPGVEVRLNPARARLNGDRLLDLEWEFDELVLTLDLYLKHDIYESSTEPHVVALSELLQRLPIYEGTRPLRDPETVVARLRRWRAIDPASDDDLIPRLGTRREREVWDRFIVQAGAEADELDAVVEAIKSVADDSAPVLLPEEGEAEAVEGRLLFRQHRVRERDPKIVKLKKAAELDRTGRLACEVCGFDFAATYGELGEGFIECHHELPLGTAGTRTTQIADLALVCPNCHRMLHRSREPLSIEDLRARLQRG